MTFVHQAELELADGTDARAPGGEITRALCGHWEHEPPCEWPHHNAIDTDAQPAVVRTVFAADEADAAEVRRRIEEALSDDHRWRLVSAGPAAPRPGDPSPS